MIDPLKVSKLTNLRQKLAEGKSGLLYTNVTTMNENGQDKVDIT